MKIALVTTWDSLCGIAIYMRHYVLNLPKENLDLKVFCEKDILNFKGKKVPRISTLPDIPYEKCWSRLEDFQELFNKIIEYKPDIMHICHEPGIFGLDIRLIKLFNSLRISKIKTVMQPLAPLPRLIEYYAQLNADSYIVNDFPEELIMLPKYGMPKDKLFYIPLGVHVMNLFSKEEARKELGIPLEKKILLTTGFIREATGVKDIITSLLPVVLEYPETLMIFAGYIHPFDSDRWIKEGEEHAKFLELEKNVLFTKKFHSEKELELYGSASDIYLHYRKHYGLPISSGTSMRAIGCALPIIAYDCPAVDVIQKGIVKIHNEQEMANQILDLFKNKEKYLRLKKEIEELRKEWSWKEVAPQYLEVYKKVLNATN